MADTIEPFVVKISGCSWEVSPCKVRLAFRGAGVEKVNVAGDSGDYKERVGNEVDGGFSFGHHRLESGSGGRGY